MTAKKPSGMMFISDISDRGRLLGAPRKASGSGLFRTSRRATMADRLGALGHFIFGAWACRLASAFGMTPAELRARLAVVAFGLLAIYCGWVL